MLSWDSFRIVLKIRKVSFINCEQLPIDNSIILVDYLFIIFDLTMDTSEFLYQLILAISIT